MIIAKSKNDNYMTEITDGQHSIFSDTDIKNGGKNMRQNASSIFFSGYAACVNVTTRMVLDKQNLAYDDVIVTVDYDNSDLDNLKIYTKTEIIGNIPQEKKNEIINKVKRCPVARMMRSNKEFLDME